MKPSVPRIALAASLLIFGMVTLANAAEPLRYAEQGWTPSERRAWYSATQGSRLIPASWLQALEQADAATPFLTAENMERYRYLSNETSPNSNYPIGFAEDIQSDRFFRRTNLRWYAGQGERERWVGFTCAACHTAEFRYNGQRVRVDGAPSMSDFQGFVEGLDRALHATLSDPAKFQRFAARVLGTRNSETNRARLLAALRRLYDWEMEVDRINETPMRYGFARLDAIGHILNRVSLFNGATSPTANPADAPVSYPFLWNTPQHDRVQWNGSARNERTSLGGARYIDLPALGRNTGEVIGVFGEVVPSPVTSDPRDGLYASVFVDNLEKMEKLVGKLDSPAWPAAVFGPLDPGRVRRGADLFEQRCASCHRPLSRGNLAAPVTAQMSYFQPDPASRIAHRPPGTDPAMACRAFDNISGSGVLAGLPYKDERQQRQRIRDPERVATLLPAMVREVLMNQKGEIATTIASIAIGRRRSLVVHNPGAQLQTWVRDSRPGRATHRTRADSRARVQAGLAELEPYISSAPQVPRQLPSNSAQDWGPFNACVNGPWSSIKGYKARPLNGIWATAPYLHNGSVANLYELLLPPSARMPFFYVGTREFDPVNVGFVTRESAENSFRLESYDAQGAIIWGNWNGGHDYDNASLNRDMRLDLVEYLKSL
jgi:mono/diheme cytochrome c family protein